MQKKHLIGAGITAFSVILGLLWLIPLIWLVGTAFSVPSFHMTLFPTTAFTLDNIKYVWNAIPFGTYYINTLTLVVCTFAVQFFTSTLAAYALAVLDFKGQALVFAGIFVWNVRTITSVMRVYAPGIAQIFDRIFPDFYTEKENESIKKLFPTCESISIDYAVMEKAQEIYVLPASFGWSDLGTWGALRGLLPQDKSGNAMVGTDIRLYESKNCIVHTSEEKRVVIQGLDGYIIAEKDDTLLICKLEEEQRIKEFSK